MAAFSFAINSGLQDVSDSFSDQLVLDMSDTIAMLDDDESQFFTMVSRPDLGARTAFQPKFSWLEDSYRPDTTTVATSATSVATTITVATGTGSYFRAGDVVRNISKGDAYLVTSSTSADITVTRAIGGATASAAATGDRLIIVSSASLEGAAAPTAIHAEASSNYNYTQIQRDPLYFTRTNEGAERYGGQEPMREKAKKFVEHRRALNQIAFTGARHIVTSGSEPQRLTGGALEYVTVNKTNIAGTLTAIALDSHLTDVMQYGSQDKVLFVGPIVARALSGFLRDAWQPNTVGEKKYGAKVSAVISGAFGYTVPVVVMRNWSRLGLGGYCFTLDMSNVRYVTYRNGATRYRPNIQAPDRDAFMAEYLTEAGYEFRIDESHGILYGITG